MVGVEWAAVRCGERWERKCMVLLLLETRLTGCLESGVVEWWKGRELLESREVQDGWCDE